MTDRRESAPKTSSCALLKLLPARLNRIRKSVARTAQPVPERRRAGRVPRHQLIPAPGPQPEGSNCEFVRNPRAAGERHYDSCGADIRLPGGPVCVAASQTPAASADGEDMHPARDRWLLKGLPDSPGAKRELLRRGQSPADAAVGDWSRLRRERAAADR